MNEERAKEEVLQMIDKIDECIGRVLKSKPYTTRIKLAEDEWLINDANVVI